MHSKNSASLVLETLPSGESAWLRPRPRDLPALCAPRSAWPTFVISSQTVYEVSAPTAERALRWFADDQDMDLDVYPVDFGTVHVLGQVDDEDPRYVLTAKGREVIAS